MRDQPIAGLEQPKVDLVLIQLQKLKELVQDVGLGQEVGTIIGAEQKIRSLDFLKHRTDLLFDLGRNRGRRIAVQAAQNVCGMLVVLGSTELLQNLSNVILIEFRNVRDTALTDF